MRVVSLLGVQGPDDSGTKVASQSTESAHDFLREARAQAQVKLIQCDAPWQTVECDVSQTSSPTCTCLVGYSKV